jgi:hypothetical protein
MQREKIKAALNRAGSALLSRQVEDEKWKEVTTSKEQEEGRCWAMDALMLLFILHGSSPCLAVQFHQQIQSSFTYRSKLKDVQTMSNKHDKSKSPSKQASMSKPDPSPSPCRAIISNHHKPTKGQKIQLHS